MKDHGHQRMGILLEAESIPDEAREILLENPLRRRIHEVLEERPGMNKHQLTKTLGVHVNTLDFHLKRLVAVGLIVTRTNGGHENLCFTENNIGMWDEKSTRILFGRSTPRQTALFLVNNPGSDVDDIAAAIGLTPHTVRRHIRALEDCVLLKRVRVGKHVVHYARPRLVDWFRNTPRFW